MAASRWAWRCLDGAACAAFSYLCIGELLPVPAIEAIELLRHWGLQQAVLLALVSCLAVLLTAAPPRGGGGGLATAASLFIALNVAPVVAAALATRWSPVSPNCPVVPGEDCDGLGVVLDVVGFVSARIARLDLAICLLLAARGDSAWLLGSTDGWLGYAEAMPLHRTAGWWCAGQSALHSVAYLLFYAETGGLRSVWFDCLPAPLPDGTLNRLGLVNGLGLLAFLLLLALALPALAQFRQRCYHVFQRVHLPLGALFVLCCALHDLPVLLFCAPGLSVWYLGWRGAGRSPRSRFPAKARLLPHTSGPWVELTIDCGALLVSSSGRAPRGQWM